MAKGLTFMDEQNLNLQSIPTREAQYFSDDVRHYQQLFDLNLNPMMVYCDDGLIELNKATLQMFNAASRDVLLGLHLFSLAPDCQPNGVASKELFSHLLQEASSKGSANIQCICKRFDSDDEFPVEMVMSLLDLSDQTLYQVTLVDLSHQQRWQNALQVEKEHVELTLKHVDNAVITASQNGLVTYINEAACQLTGWNYSEAIGVPVKRVVCLVKKASNTLLSYYSSDEGRSFNSVEQLPRHVMLVTKGGQRVPVQGKMSTLEGAGEFATGCVITLVDTTEHSAYSEEMIWHATHDMLTRLPNRALLTDRFEQALHLASRHGTNLAVCMMDLDEFKPVNDTYGHEVGDKLLIEVASRLKKQLRQEDTVARLGGDEFVILIGEVSQKLALVQALYRLKAAVSAPYRIDNKTIAISCSIGVANYSGEKVNADTLLRQADQAMYDAKQSGRNRIHWFDVEQNQKAHDSEKVIKRIERALAAGEFELHYQPQVNMRTAEVVGMEGLLRWRHPEKGLILPMEFLPIIEQHELIISLGEWVIASALEQLSVWQKQGKQWTVSVNIAAKHFHLPSFYRRLRDSLKQYANVEPNKFEIEILESAALWDIQHVQAAINNCKGLGVRFALDDFGTGYSSLGYLKRLPADRLKIDQSFVSDILNDKEDLALVQAIISLATTFEREVLAEGVETAEQGGLLMRLGCDVAQGDGIAKAMPAEAVMAWSEKFTPDARWSVWSETEWDLKVFPLLVAQYDIREWVNNVLNPIEDETLAAEKALLSDENRCRFGAWYHSDGLKQYGHLANFGAIDKLHRRLHSVGDQVIQLYKAHHKQEAKEKCAELREIKDGLLSILDELQLKVFSS